MGSLLLSSWSDGNGCDGLIGQLVIGGNIVLDKLHVELITDIIDLFVDLGKMVVSLLTGTSNSVLDTARTVAMSQTMFGLQKFGHWQKFQG